MRLNVPLYATVASTCLLLGGCRDQPPAPPAAATPHAVIAFPNSIQLSAGSSAQLQAQVNDERDQPIGGASIVFRSKDPNIVGVTPDGLVSALGPVGVSAVQVASGVRVVEVPVRVIAGAGAVLEALRAPSEAAQAGTSIGDVTVQLRDQFNNPVSDATLAWKVDEQTGSIEPASTTTTADGTAIARWIAATTTGPHTLEVRSGGLPPLVLNVQVTAGPPVAIQLRMDPTLEQGASGSVGDALPVQVLVTDAHGNGVSDVEVELEASGACKAESTLQKTGVTGATPASSWQMKKQGSCVIVAKTSSPPMLEAKMEVPVTSAVERK